MRIVLKRKIPSISYAVRMSVFVSEKRPELLPLLMAVKESNEKTIHPIKYINEMLFQNFSEKFVSNILEELKILDLIDSSYALSSRGVEALEEESILTPDEGAFEIQTVTEAILPQVIIDLKRLTPNLDKELRESQVGNKDKKIKLPEHILKTEGTKIRTLEKTPRLIDIHEIHESGKINKSSSVQIDIILIYSEGKWESKISIRNIEFPFPFPEGYDHKLLVDQLLRELSPNADLKKWRIPQDPLKLSLSETNSFLKNFEKTNVKLGDLGKFSTVKFFDVSIFPSNKEKALIWAKTIFTKRKCSNYIIGDQYEIQWEEMLDEFSELKQFDIDSPSKTEIIEELEFGSQKYWFLQAPVDMLLDEVIFDD